VLRTSLPQDRQFAAVPGYRNVALKLSWEPRKFPKACCILSIPILRDIYPKFPTPPSLSTAKGAYSRVLSFPKCSCPSIPFPCPFPVHRPAKTKQTIPLTPHPKNKRKKTNALKKHSRPKFCLVMSLMHINHASISGISQQNKTRYS
jgi:hypothetical protein